jgi:hypothetical protein
MAVFPSGNLRTHSVLYLYTMDDGMNMKEGRLVANASHHNDHITWPEIFPWPTATV